MVPITICGYSGHGKTVYITTFYSRLSSLVDEWSDLKFGFTAADQEGLDTLISNVTTLASGTLPGRTRASFQQPVILRLLNLPRNFGGYRKLQLSVFDTAGGNLRDSGGLRSNASYVSRSPVIIWLLDPRDRPDDAHRLAGLQATMESAFDSSVRPRLILVLTKADRFVDETEFPEVAKDLLTGRIDELDLLDNTDTRKLLSTELRKWLEKDREYRNALIVLDQAFNGVTLLASSSLGSSPASDMKINSLVPRGVLLPVFYAIEHVIGRAKKLEVK